MGLLPSIGRTVVLDVWLCTTVKDVGKSREHCNSCFMWGIVARDS
jgi:hypothetical protein